MQVAAAFLAVLLVMGTVLPLNQTLAADVPADGGTVVRIGLAYGSGVVPSANLQNSVGSGYRFGYFDADRSFVSLAYTEETRITMLKTQNLYLSGSTYSATVPSGTYTAIGCYHIELPGTYPDFESAKRAATAVPGAFPAYIMGSFTVRVGAYTTKAEAEAAQTALSIAETVIKGTSTNGVSVVATGSAQILFQFDGGSERSLGVMPGLDDSVKTVTWFKGYKYYGGFQYQRIGSDLTVVNFVPLEDYVKGVVPYEMSPSWPLEALKAQAVCARNYVMVNQDKHKSYGFDVCNGTDCQVYQGLNRADSNTDAAVDQTAGVFVRYQGKLAETYFCASNGGATEDVANVWGAQYAYLKGVVDPYEALVRDKIPSYEWTTTFTAEELTTLLRSKNYSCDTIVSFEVTERSALGNVIAITFTDASGRSVYLSRERVRTVLNLRSMRYSVYADGVQQGSNGYTVTGGQLLSSLKGIYAISGTGTIAAVTGDTAYSVTGTGTVSAMTEGTSGTGNGGKGTTFTISGTGLGHNVGLSQWGAYSMANLGYTYQEILQFYYTDVTVGP